MVCKKKSTVKVDLIGQTDFDQSMAVWPAKKKNLRFFSFLPLYIWRGDFHATHTHSWGRGGREERERRRGERERRERKERGRRKRRRKKILRFWFWSKFKVS